MIGRCPNICNNKTSEGYCKTTVCINPSYQQYLITGVEDGWIKVDKKTWDEYQMMKNSDYGVGITGHNKMDNTTKQILENQEVILLTLSKLILPKCTNSETSQLNNRLIDSYHLTRKILGKDYIKR